MTWEPIIGLEIHTQLLTATKAFCNCPVQFGAPANTLVCPVCMGLPGSLPVPNRTMFDCAIKLGLATHSSLHTTTKFDRKNYFYPDNPKNYQITQFDYPICREGYLDVYTDESNSKRVRIHRIHMEEDTGKAFHDQSVKHTLIDYNRAGTPLLEIVTEPDMRSPEEAYLFLTELKALLEYLEISTGNMEEGALRVDVNVSVHRPGEPFGTKVELKNMNSFRAVEKAIQYEIDRQTALLEAGKQDEIIQETRMWLENKGITQTMRIKESSADYRYFPEPDIPAFSISDAHIESIRATLPELPIAKRFRIIRDYGITYYDATVLTSDKKLTMFFEKVTACGAQGKAAANWIINELLRYINEANITVDTMKITAEQFAYMLLLIDKGTISGKIGKDLLAEMFATGEHSDVIIARHGWVQISDDSVITDAIHDVLTANAAEVARYCNGEEKLFGFLVGQIMKQTKGKANPQMVNGALKKALDERRGT